jgi:hypothetical protein
VNLSSSNLSTNPKVCGEKKFNSVSVKVKKTRKNNEVQPFEARRQATYIVADSPPTKKNKIEVTEKRRIRSTDLAVMEYESVVGQAEIHHYNSDSDFE